MNKEIIKNINKADKSYRAYTIKVYNQRPDVKKKHAEYTRKYRQQNPEKYRQYQKKHYENHRTEEVKRIKVYNERPCKDPVLGDTVKYNTLINRKKKHPDLYGDLRVADCLIYIPKIRGLELLNEEKKED
jgi:hypothetical protein